MVADNDFLRQPLGHIGGNAAGVFADQFDLTAAGGLAVLFHVKFYAVIHLRCGVGELTGIGHDQADLHRLLSLRRGRAKKQRQRPASDAAKQTLHVYPPGFCNAPVCFEAYPRSGRMRVQRSPWSPMVDRSGDAGGLRPATGGSLKWSVGKPALIASMRTK